MCVLTRVVLIKDQFVKCSWLFTDIELALLLVSCFCDVVLELKRDVKVMLIQGVTASVASTINRYNISLVKKLLRALRKALNAKF